MNFHIKKRFLKEYHNCINAKQYSRLIKVWKVEKEIRVLKKTFELSDNENKQYWQSEVNKYEDKLNSIDTPNTHEGANNE